LSSVFNRRRQKAQAFDFAGVTGKNAGIPARQNRVDFSP
jgi:hypothetical protein